MSTNANVEPFSVKDCALVTIATGKKAQNLKEMREHLLNIHLGSVYHHFWGGLLRPRFDEPFWPEATHGLREQHPGFLFMAEVYWDLEWELMQQGFDYCYDKKLYDRLLAQDAAAVRSHLWADLAYQNKLARFLENHDEPRAAHDFPPPVHQAAAVVTYFTPGLRFFHEGQLEGRRLKVSMHLGRPPGGAG